VTDYLKSYIKGLVADRQGGTAAKAKDAMDPNKPVQVFDTPTSETKRPQETKEEKEARRLAKFKNIELDTSAPSYKSKAGMVRKNSGQSTQKEYIGGKFKDLFNSAANTGGRR
jgi:hypothetical protein